MIGVGKILKPSGVDNMLRKTRNDKPQIVVAKELARNGKHREALELLIAVGKAKPEHLQAFDNGSLEGLV